jgi:hypothetical protein
MFLRHPLIRRAVLGEVPRLAYGQGLDSHRLYELDYDCCGRSLCGEVKRQLQVGTEGNLDSLPVRRIDEGVAESIDRSDRCQDHLQSFF